MDIGFDFEDSILAPTQDFRKDPGPFFEIMDGDRSRVVVSWVQGRSPVGPQVAC